MVSGVQGIPLNVSHDLKILHLRGYLGDDNY